MRARQRSAPGREGRDAHDRRGGAGEPQPRLRPGNAAGERGTRRVVLLSAAMMAVEVVAGWLTNSMALLADGWHMGTHVAALGITAFAYWYARRHASDPRFAFGT